MDSIIVEGTEFELPPAKRQCTQSPGLPPTMGEESKSDVANTTSTQVLRDGAGSTNVAEPTASAVGPASIPGLGALHEKDVEAPSHEKPESNGILDMLMQHVESASNPTTVNKSAEATKPTQDPGGLGPPDPKSQPSGANSAHAARSSEDRRDKALVVEEAHSGDGQHRQPYVEALGRGVTTDNDPQPLLLPVEEEGGLSETQTPTRQDAEPEAAEWEADSSPLESSDSDTSDSSSSEEDGDEEMDGEYALLGLEEQARILMQGDGGSDDEGEDRKGGTKTNGAQLRTAHEKAEEVIPKPDITLTNEKIEELGSVEGVVESTVLIKAKVSGEYQVLESGSLLCLKDRTVVGVVAELFGRVEQPMYTIRFTDDAAIEEAGLSVPGTAVYYVEPPHSIFVFTQPLKSIKGSDASNFHDEEVGDDEMEFSDDEAEAEHKRRLKLRRQGKRDDRGGRSSYQGNSRRSSASTAQDGSTNGNAYSSGAMEMNYDDVDEGYTPLARPSNLHMMAQRQAPGEGRQFASTMNRRSNDRGGSRGHGRGGRGFDRNRGRGGRTNGHNPNFPAQWNEQQAPQPAFSPQYPNAAPAFVNPQTPLHPSQQPFQQPPHQHFQQVSGPPQRPTYPPPYSPSPVSPLPATQFDFNFQQPHSHAQQFGSHSPPGQYGGPPPTQSQMPMPPPGSHVNPAFLAALRQHQQQGQR